MSGGPASPAAPSDDASLDRQIRRFSRYLANVDPSGYQLAKYREYHRIRPLLPRSDFDRLLLALADGSAIGLRLADAYSGTFQRASVVRRKLILTVALLESAAPTFPVLDKPDGPGLVTFARLTVRGASALATLVIAALLLAPAHVLLGRAHRHDRFQGSNP